MYDHEAFLLNRIKRRMRMRSRIRMRSKMRAMRIRMTIANKAT